MSVVGSDSVRAGAAGDVGSDVGDRVAYSLRLNSGDSAHMTATPGGAQTSVRLGTLSVWVKRCALGEINTIINQHRASTTNHSLLLRFQADDTLQFLTENGSGAAVISRVTNQVFRDPTGWMHIHVAWDSGQTDNTACTLSINGTAITDFGTTTNPGSATDLEWLNTSKALAVGRQQTPGNYCNLYLSQLIVVDGQKLAATSFGRTSSDTGVWVPTNFRGTYGDEGFRLNFVVAPGSGNGAGTDASGNANHMADSGLAANDMVEDSPTDNFCVLNVLDNDSLTVSNGNLTVKSPANAHNAIGSTWSLSSGKWYWEFVADEDPDPSLAHFMGVAETSFRAITDYTNDAWNFSSIWSYQPGDGKKSNGAGLVTYGSGGTTGTVYSTALDLDNGKIYWGTVSGGTITWEASGDPVAGMNPAYTNLAGKTVYPFYGNSGNPVQFSHDFGQLGFSASSLPTGFKALKTSNLPEPDVADSSENFQATTYTGNGGTLAVNQSGNSTFSPDLVWIKNRDTTDAHCLFDTARGATIRLSSDSVDVEATDTDTLTAFDSDGFTVGADVKVNTNTENYVAWQWLESTTPGFDLVGYTGNITNRTISHSLGAVPAFMVVKSRSSADDWAVYHKANTAAPQTDYLLLNETNATADSVDYWNDTAPTSTEFTVGISARVNQNSGAMIAMLWSEVEGFSRFGSYTGNGSSTNGPFIHLGFRPAFFMYKPSSNAGTHWGIIDAAREPGNSAGNQFTANATSAEASNDHEFDFCSNGVKVRDNSSSSNGSGYTILYAAFAEAPFKFARSR